MRAGVATLAGAAAAGRGGYEEAVRDVHALLLKAARFEVGRQHARLAPAVVPARLAGR